MIILDKNLNKISPIEELSRGMTLVRDFDNSVLVVIERLSTGFTDNICLVDLSTGLIVRSFFKGRVSKMREDAINYLNSNGYYKKDIKISFINN